MVALRGVVVDDVQDHLDARRVQRADHLLELLDHPLDAPRGVRVVRGQVADRVVAPVVGKSALGQVVVVDELVHWHQLDRGYPDAPQMLDRGGMGQAGVGAAELRRDLRVGRREALDVQLVHDRVVPGTAQVRVAAPVEVRVGDDRLGDAVLRIEVAARDIVASERVRVRGPAPIDGAGHRLRVRVDQQLRGITAQTPARVVWPVDPEPVALTGPHSG